MIRFCIHRDLFSRNVREWSAPADGRLLLGHLPAGCVKPDTLVVVNGEAMSGDRVARYVPANGDLIEIERIPFGPGIAIPAIVGVGISFVSAGVQAALTPVVDAGPRPLSLREDEGSNPARGWRGFQTTRGPGRPIPLVFGEVRCAGQMIESFYEPAFIKYDVPATADVVAQQFFSSAARVRLATRVGYCVGPVEEINSLEIDDNAIDNYGGSSYEVLLGTIKQQAPDGFNETKTIQDVSTTVTYSGGAVSKTTTTYCTTVELKIVFTAGLSNLDSLDQRIANTVDIKFEYKKTTDAGWTTYATVTVQDECVGAFPVWIRFPRLDYAKYDVRVTRMTADHTGDQKGEFDWDLMQEVLAGERSHPGIAQVAYRQFPTEQNPVPRNYTAVVKGINNMRIYSDPGTYTTGWSNNPAWCLAWFLTDPKHGLGKFFDWDHIDLVSFCDFANDCDEMVSDGRDGKEKRATFDYEFNSPIKAQEALAKFTEGTRAYPPQYVGGKWRIVLDVPGEPRQLFHEGNILPGTVNYQWLETMTRPTRVLCNFQNEENDYEIDTFLQEDPELVAGDYVVDQQLSIAGVTRPSQIARQCLRLLDQRRLRDRTIELSAGVEAYRLVPGDLVDVATVAAGLGIASGLILDVSTDYATLKIDDDLTLNPSNDYEVTVYHKLDGRTERKALTGIAADPTQHVTVSNTIWLTEPLPGDGYSIGLVEYATERFRVMEISEDAEFNRKLTCHLFVEVEERIISNPDILNYRIGNPRHMPAALTGISAYWLDPQDSGTDTVSNIDGAWDPSVIRQYVGRSVYEFDYSRFDVYVRKQGDEYWHFARTFETLVHAGAAVSQKLFTKDHTLEFLIVGVTTDGIRLPLDQHTATTVQTPT